MNKFYLSSFHLTRSEELEVEAERRAPPPQLRHFHEAAVEEPPKCRRQKFL
jgi:hypothetical protein